jgi:hypothetical protein
MAKCLCDCPDLPEGTAVVLVSNRGQHHLDLSEGCRSVCVCLRQHAGLHFRVPGWLTCPRSPPALVHV